MGIFHVRPGGWPQVVWIGDLECMAPMFARAQLIKSPHDLRWVGAEVDEIAAWMESTNLKEILLAFDRLGIQGAIKLWGDEVRPASPEEPLTHPQVTRGDQWRIAHPAEVHCRILGQGFTLDREADYRVVALALESVHFRALVGFQLALTYSSVKAMTRWLIRDSPASGDERRLMEAMTRWRQLAEENYWFRGRFTAARFDEMLSDLQFEVDSNLEGSVLRALGGSSPEDFSVL